MSFFRKLTVCGVNISRFDILVDDSSETAEIILTNELAEEMQKFFSEKLIGRELNIVKNRWSNINYIVLSASNISVNDYSVKIADGNIYIKGSYFSINKAIECFYRDVLGYREGQSGGKAKDITEKDSLCGSLSYKVSYTKQDMLRLMKDVYNDDDKVLSGCHTYSTTKRSSIFNGSGIRDTRDAIMKKTGKTPVILELDAGSYSIYVPEHFGRDTLGAYDLSKILSEALEFASEGGIISVCIHMANPLENYKNAVWWSGTLESREKAIEMLTEGTAMHDLLRKTIAPTVKLLKGLKENNIPFMFRPLHEMNASGFWWSVGSGGGKIIDAEVYKMFWMFFYKLVTEEIGFNDVLWVYAPNHSWDGIASTVYAYPGDEYVDIVGVDWYTGKYFELNQNGGYNKLMETGKPVALTETGNGWTLNKTAEDGSKYIDFSGLDLLEILKRMRNEGFKTTYFETWTRSMSLASYAHSDILMADPMVITLEDMNDYWNKIKGEKK